MLDLSDAAFRAQLIEPGTYDGRLFKARVVGSGPVFMVFTWKLDVRDRDVPASVEEFIRIDSGPDGDPAQTVVGRTRLKAILEAHGIEPTFAGYDDLIRTVQGKQMQVVVRHGRKSGLPVAKVADLLPPAVPDP